MNNQELAQSLNTEYETIERRQIVLTDKYEALKVEFKDYRQEQISFGKKLKETKKSLPNRWNKFCNDELVFSAQQANKYMRVAENEAKYLEGDYTLDQAYAVFAIKQQKPIKNVNSGLHFTNKLEPIIKKNLNSEVKDNLNFTNKSEPEYEYRYGQKSVKWEDSWEYKDMQKDSKKSAEEFAERMFGEDIEYIENLGNAS